MDTYKWNEGFYSLQDLVILTKYKNLTIDEFYKVTHLTYKEAIQKVKKQEVH